MPARRRLVHAFAVAAFATVAAVLGATPGAAHGFSSTVYADLTSPERGHVRAALGLEYDLLVVSAADAGRDDPLFRQGTAAFDARDTQAQAAALGDHAAAVEQYVTARFRVTADGQACAPARDGGFTIEEREGVPYARMALDFRCPQAEAHEVTSTLFPDSEQYVRDTKTIVTYALDLASGSAALDAHQPSVSTRQAWTTRFGEFFRLGAEHLLTGLDHLLFLLALIAGSRRPREIVLAATTFTLAHSVTFVLAALGLVHVPAAIIEPLIALSIAVVAAWPLWRLWRGSPGLDGDGHFSLDRAGWLRLGVVFCFGLAHGLGFASALGIDTAWSWTLLWSLLVFNLGIEAVQLALIALVFPVLVLLRRRSPAAPRWTTGVLAAAVSVVGLTWFVERVAGG